MHDLDSTSPFDHDGGSDQPARGPGKRTLVERRYGGTVRRRARDDSDSSGQREAVDTGAPIQTALLPTTGAPVPDPIPHGRLGGIWFADVELGPTGARDRFRLTLEPQARGSARLGLSALSGDAATGATSLVVATRGVLDPRVVADGS